MRRCDAPSVVSCRSRSGAASCIRASSSACSPLREAFVLNSLLSVDGWQRAVRLDAQREALIWTLLWAPMTMMFLAIPAIRLALSVPLDLRSNWIFRMTEDVAGRAEVVAANVRIVLALGVALPLALILGRFNGGCWGPSALRVIGRRGVDRLAARRVADGGLASHSLHVLVHPRQGIRASHGRERLRVVPAVQLCHRDPSAPLACASAGGASWLR